MCFGMKAVGIGVWLAAGGPVWVSESQVLPGAVFFPPERLRLTYRRGTAIAGTRLRAHRPREADETPGDGWGPVALIGAFGGSGSKPRFRRTIPHTRSTGGELHGCNAPETGDEACFGSFCSPCGHAPIVWEIACLVHSNSPFPEFRGNELADECGEHGPVPPRVGEVAWVEREIAIPVQSRAIRAAWTCEAAHRPGLR